MDLGAFFLILALVLLVAAILARPFIQHAHPALEAPQAGENLDHQRSELLAERDRLLVALQELEFDHELGKIAAEDYPAQRAVLRQAAADVLRRLDQLALETNDDSVSAPPPLENPVETTDDEIEAMIQARRRNRKEKSGGFCPACGKAVLKSDRFCSSCGAPL